MAQCTIPGRGALGKTDHEVRVMLRRRSRQPAFLAAAIAMLWATAGYAQDAEEQPSGTYIDGVYVENYVYAPKYIPPQELKKLIDGKAKDIVIVDTAAPLIYEEEHIPGAVNFPWGPTLAQPITLPRDKTLVIYCACNDEEESIDTAKKLAEFGYTNVKVLKGGWFEWLKLGFDTEGQAAEG
jgi:rhodanese-related sulfurtransferase